ncbi:hypothetical protein ACIBM3_22885 [Rhodococcus erythropolis]|uniref:hypothetical protein n=1 Tax=Rhodococcus erythropolis TaxID=1833 RepID=UPI0037A47F9C
MIPTPESGPSSPSMAAARDDEATARKVMNIVMACVEQIESLSSDGVSTPAATGHVQQLAVDISGVTLDALLRWPQ